MVKEKLKKMPGRGINSCGFSLVEMMIALLLGMIASIGIYKSYTSFSINAQVQEQLVEMQQNLRYGMKKMTQEVRRAGFDPTDSGTFGLYLADCTSTILKFSYDLDEDGVKDSDEIITYSFDTGSNQLRRAEGVGAAQAVIDNVNGLQFVYYGATTYHGYTPGTTTRALHLSLVVKSANKDIAYTDNSTDYRNLFGDRIALYNDANTVGNSPNFHRRVMSTKIWARNLSFNANKVP